MDVHEAQVAGDGLESAEVVVGGVAEMADEVGFGGELSGEFFKGLVAFPGGSEEVDGVGAESIVG